MICAAIYSNSHFINMSSYSNVDFFPDHRAVFKYQSMDKWDLYLYIHRTSNLKKVEFDVHYSLYLGSGLSKLSKENPISAKVLEYYMSLKKKISVGEKQTYEVVSGRCDRLMPHVFTLEVLNIIQTHDE